MTPRFSRPQRMVAWALALLAAAHVVLTIMWVGPSNAITDELIPRKTLSKYIEPMFSQSWSVFAPNPMNGTYHLKVRAILVQDGERETTEWVDATAAEYTFKHHNLAPGRASKSADILAQRYKKAYDGLAEDQTVYVSYDYFKEDWQERFETRLLDNAESEGKTRTYVRMDRMITAYSTQVAYAVWGSDVQRVQFEVSRTVPVPFSKRDDPDTKPRKPAVIDSGWRGTVVEEGQNQERFAKFFLRGLEGAKKRG